MLNGPHHEDNPKTLEEIGGTKVLCHLPRLNELNAKTLLEEWQRQSLSTTFKQLLQK